MVGWHHWLSGHEFEWAPGVGDGQGSLVCCSPWGHKESDMTEWQNWTEPGEKKNARDTQIMYTKVFLLWKLNYICWPQNAELKTLGALKLPVHLPAPLTRPLISCPGGWDYWLPGSHGGILLGTICTANDPQSHWVYALSQSHYLDPSFFLFFIRGWSLYNFVLVSAIHQHQSAIGIHRSPPSRSSLPPPTPSHPSRSSQSTSLSYLPHSANSHWLFYIR